MNVNMYLNFKFIQNIQILLRKYVYHFMLAILIILLTCNVINITK